MSIKKNRYALSSSLTAHMPPPRFSFHHLFFILVKVPFSWSCSIDSLIGWRYGESEKNNCFIVNNLTQKITKWTMSSAPIKFIKSRSLATGCASLVFYFISFNISRCVFIYSNNWVRHRIWLIIANHVVKLKLN